MTEKRTCKGAILERLKMADRPLAAHELNSDGFFTGYSENCMATRLAEMAKDGLVVGAFRDGKNFKEWRLNAD